MSASDDMYNALKDIPAIEGRVWPDVAPLNSQFPLLTFERVEMLPVSTIHGQVYGYETFFDVICHESTREGASALADTVVAACIAAGFWIISRQSLVDEERDSEGEEVSVGYFYSTN